MARQLRPGLVHRLRIQDQDFQGKRFEGLGLLHPEAEIWNHGQDRGSKLEDLTYEQGLGSSLRADSRILCLGLLFMPQP